MADALYFNSCAMARKIVLMELMRLTAASVYECIM
jgi:hypothetical protein